MARFAASPRKAASKRQPFARAIEIRVRGFIEQTGALRPGESALVAVSGGADSTAMLLILSRLAREFGWRLTVAHFDHGLRGKEAAAADRTFVSGLAQSLGLPFVHGAGDVARRARTRSESVEQAARVLRYRFLAGQAKATGVGAVAVGHTLDDQAETVLLHLIRGSGLDGLAGMRPRSSWPLGCGPEVARPLLTLRREETGRYCREMGMLPREDAMNEMLLATRNRVRLEVMPALRRLNPRVEEALARLADAAYEDGAELKEQAEEAIMTVSRRRAGGLEMDLGALRGLSPTLRRRVLRLGLSRVLGSGADIETAHVDALGKLVDSRPGRVSLPHGVVATRDSRMLTLRRGALPVSPAIPETPLVVPGVTEAGGWRFEAEYKERRSSARRAYEVELDTAAVAGGLWVRSRRPGDRMRPLGLGGTKKLQDILVDAKVPRGDRDGVPLVLTAEGIAWAVGVCLDERAARARSGRVVRVRARRLRGAGSRAT